MGGRGSDKVTHKILVVEDNPSILALVRALLQSNGYEVETALEPADVIRRVDASRPALVLMDLNLPESDGLTLTRQIKARRGEKSPIILAFTAMAMQEDRDRALAAGCDGYVSKPIHLQTFLQTLRSFLEPAS